MTDIKPADITRRVAVMQLAPPVWHSTAELRYEHRDPFAVQVVFDTDDGENTWRFSRDVLYRGLHEHSGIGDVRIWPDGNRLIVALSSPEGSAQLAFGGAAVRRFLTATYRAVPRGEESADIDGLIEQLLGGA